MDLDLKTALPQGLELLGSALAVTGIGAAPGAILSGIGELVGHALGVTPTVQNLHAGLQNLTAEQQSALLSLQENNKAELQKTVIQADTATRQLAAQEAIAVLQDRADARKRDTAMIQGGRINIRADLMLALAFFAVIAIAALLALGKVDQATAAGGFLITIGGMFARNIGTAFDFEFGSSRDSASKTQALAAAAKATAS